MGIDYMFANLDKKEYIDASSRVPHADDEMLFLVYLIMYDWNGDRIKTVRDPESLWEEIYEGNGWKYASMETYKDFQEEFKEYHTSR